MEGKIRRREGEKEKERERERISRKGERIEEERSGRQERQR